MPQSSIENKTDRFPPQIKYIVGNEAAERFSFYGMRSILVVFMMQQLLMPENEAKGIYHLFVSAAYFTTLLGGYLSDRYWGKYHTIIWLSLIYCAGHAVLSIRDDKFGLLVGLTLIAIGAGGIKPCVSAHVGDQFDKTNKHLLSKMFSYFSFSINFGAFFSQMLIPAILPRYGAKVAFGIPGVLMFLATYVFWLGRKYYIYVPPTGKANSSQFFAILFYAFTHTRDRKPNEHFLDTAKAQFDAEKVEGAKSVTDIFKVFIAISMFWALYDQQASTWIIQAGQMNLTVMGIKFEASQTQALNAIFILILIPIFIKYVYPMVEKMGIRLTALRKMSAGMVLTGMSFVVVAVFQVLLDRGIQLSIAWQVIPYLIITVSEILVYITGLEFAYTQAPRAMKSTVMSLLFLTISVGNWLTAVISYLNPFQGTNEFVFYAIIMFVVSAIFIWTAASYRERQHIEEAGAFSGH